MFGANVPVPLVLQIPDPEEELPFNVTSELFAHTVWSGPAFTTAGVLITTVTVETALVHPAADVMNKLYVPAAAVVTFGIVLFCVVELKPFGPLQLYVAPTTLFAFSVSVDPVQTGELLEALAGGVGFTTTVTVAGELAQPLFTVTVYVPAAASVTLAIEGFCNVELNPFGPVQE